MTTEQSTKLEELRKKYSTAKSNYEIELKDNYNFRQAWIETSNTGTTINGNDSAWFYKMVKASDESLVLKKNLMDAALLEYNAYLQFIKEDEKAIFNQQHPELVTQLEEIQVKGENEIKIKELELEKQAQVEKDKLNYSSKATNLFIAAFVIIALSAITAYTFITRKTS